MCIAPFLEHYQLSQHSHSANFLCYILFLEYYQCRDKPFGKFLVLYSGASSNLWSNGVKRSGKPDLVVLGQITAEFLSSIVTYILWRSKKTNIHASKESYEANIFSNSSRETSCGYSLEVPPQ